MEDEVDESQVRHTANNNSQTDGDSSRLEVGLYSVPDTQFHNPRQQQTDLQSIYGDPLPATKGDESVLFTFLNINGLPQDSTKHKNRTIRNFMNNYNIDIFGMAEVNLNWNLLPTKDRWEERTIGWWEDSRVTIAHNVEDEATQVFQPGGCIQVTTNKLISCWTGNGVDPTGLGRWTWSTYVGKNNTTL